MKKMERLLSTKGKMVVAVVFITLLSTYPYVFNRFFALPELTPMIAIELFLLIILNIVSGKGEAIPKSLLAIVAVQNVVFFLLFAIHGDTFYLMRFSLFSLITLYTIYTIQNIVGISNFIHINNIWIAIQCILGIIGFFLIMADVIRPLKVYFDENSYNVDYFYGITTTNAIIGNIPRIAGFFDEPGAFAQWGVFALVLNKISRRNNQKIELFLIVGLIFTFSLAYYIQLVVYFILFYYSKKRKLIIILIGIVGVYLFAQQYIPEDSDLYSLTFKRTERNYGRIETNRDSLTETAKKYYLMNPIFGKGYTYMVENAQGFYDNPYETLATSGILGTFALYLPLFVILLRYRKNGAWQAVIVLFIGYLQRPFHIQYIHYLMLYLLFYVCYNINKPHYELQNKIIE